MRLGAADVLQLGVVGIRTRPLRAGLSGLGIAIGIATLVVVVGISGSSSAGLADRLNSLGADLLLAQAQAQHDERTAFVADAESATLRIGPVTSAAQLGSLPGVVVRRSALISRDDVVGLNAFAATPELRSELHARMAGGSFLTARTARLRIVVLGHAAAANLGIDSAVLREHPQISLGATDFTVTGILDPLNVTPDLDYGVFVGWGTARAALHFDGHATSMYLRADQSSLDQVAGVLGPTLYPAEPGLVNVSRPSTALAAKQAVDTSASGLVLGLATISLVVGGIGIANTMYLAVIERRREIGLRRALGATRGHIRMQFLVEAAVLAVAGSLTGIVAGALSTAAYAVYNGLPAVVPLAVVGIGLAGGLIVGVLAGLYPAVRAARLTPTECLAST